MVIKDTGFFLVFFLLYAVTKKHKQRVLNYMEDNLKKTGAMLGDTLLTPKKDRWIQAWKGSTQQTDALAELTYHREVTAFQNALQNDHNDVSKDSIVSAWFDVATMGLSIADKEVYLISYGGKLTAQVGFQGKIRAINRVYGYETMKPIIVYDGDELEVEGYPTQVKHYKRVKTKDEKPLQVLWRVYTPNRIMDFIENYNDLLKHKRFSKKPKMWDLHQDAMVLKTMINVSFKFLRSTLPEKHNATISAILNEDELNTDQYEQGQVINIDGEDQPQEDSF